MLIIETKPKEEMIADGINSFPDECCGFMFGTEDGDTRTVTTSLVVHNSKEGDKRRRFEISPMDYMNAERYADEHNLLLLGIYHSHPNHPSIPSEHDRVAAQVYFSYVIISIREAAFSTIQSWRLNEASQFEEEQIIL
ncbi:MAG: M67 family metallopeptidase [Ferruginibacter sp.]